MFYSALTRPQSACSHHSTGRGSSQSAAGLHALVVTDGEERASFLSGVSEKMWQIVRVETVWTQVGQCPRVGGGALFTWAEVASQSGDLFYKSCIHCVTATPCYHMGEQTLLLWIKNIDFFFTADANKINYQHK